MTPYLPTLAYTHKPRYSPHQRTGYKALFPRYLFVGLNPASPEWQTLRDTEGILGILSNQGTPLQIGYIAIARLQMDIAMGKYTEPQTALPATFAPGDIVKIASGPLEGVTGAIKRVQGRKAYLTMKTPQWASDGLVSISVEQLRRTE